MGQKEDWLCVCGHPASEHRRGGSCRKKGCLCKSYSMAPHDQTKCNCISCLRAEITTLKKTLRTIDGVLQDDLLPFKDRVENAAFVILGQDGGD